jgi:hypothetical protein
MRLLLLISLFVALPAHADIQPGNWEITATTQVKGIREPTSMVQTRCLTEEEARDPGRIFGAAPGARCQFSERNDTGSVYTFRITCEGQVAIRGSGRVRYSGASLDGELELESDTLSAASRISGRRLGACP